MHECYSNQQVYCQLLCADLKSRTTPMQNGHNDSTLRYSPLLYSTVLYSTLLFSTNQVPSGKNNLCSAIDDVQQVPTGHNDLRSVLMMFSRCQVDTMILSNWQWARASGRFPRTLEPRSRGKARIT